MAVTTPDNIVTPDDGDDYALVQDLGAMADSVQEAITNWKNYAIGTDAQRLSLTVSSNPPLKNGLLWYSTDTGILYLRSGGDWETVLGPDTGWVTVAPGALLTYAPGWSGFTSSDWQGLKYRLRNGLMHVTGAVQKSSWTAAEVFVNIDATVRPMVPIRGDNCEIRSAPPFAQIRMAASGTTALAVNIIWPVG